MRLFIAITFSDILKKKIYGLEMEMKKYADRGNFTSINNLHLTLAFLGEVPQNQLRFVTDAMKASEGQGCFPLRFTEFGKFNNRGENLYWIGAQHHPLLLSLQTTLIEALKKAGFSPDEKIFKPHVTLVRRCVMSKAFNEDILKKNLPEMEMAVDTIHLMKSERIRGELTYTRLAAVKLY